MKRIAFCRNKGVGYKTQKEVFEFEDDVTEEEIHEAYIDWVWQEINDEFTWFSISEEE